LRNADGVLIDEADAVVLANAGDAMRQLDESAWPMEQVRGQISMLDASRLPCVARIPVAGAGYLLPPDEGMVCFGATSQPGDTEPDCRSADHAHNLAQLSALLGRPVDATPEALSGRVAWRWVTADRLPIIGSAPDRAAAANARLDQPRFVPRLPGLFVFTGLGSRGITWCALGAQVVAAAITGAPSPLESSLLDAVDPARFISRRARRAGSATPQ
jgi:tRNA 5-methylaminomethyl-2-thiouridine biosynthesis bifunctional protein